MHLYLQPSGFAVDIRDRPKNNVGERVFIPPRDPWISNRGHLDTAPEPRNRPLSDTILTATCSTSAMAKTATVMPCACGAAGRNPRLAMLLAAPKRSELTFDFALEGRKTTLASARVLTANSPSSEISGWAGRN